MKVYRNVVLLVVAVTGSFALYGGSVPQISTADPMPVEIGETPEEMVAAGQIIFERENSCLTCHSIGPDANARCPDQVEASRNAHTRKPELTPAEFLVESVYSPNTFVLEGFPSDQMRPVNGPPLALSADEVKAVLCYIWSLANPVDAEFVAAIEAAQEPYEEGLIQVMGLEADVAMGLAEDPEERSYQIEDGQQAFADMKCWQCHTIAGVEWSEWTDVAIEIDDAAIGPDLSNIGAIQTPKYILESMLYPSAVIVAPLELHADEQGLSKMPEYHDSMTVRQLIDLVAYQLSLVGEGS